MAAAPARNTARVDAFGKVRQWTRERFALPADATVLVSEMACALPGCPPLETHVLFLGSNGSRHHFRIFKPVTGVLPDDLPYAWLKDALVVPDGAGCACC